MVVEDGGAVDEEVHAVVVDDDDAGVEEVVSVKIPISLGRRVRAWQGAPCVLRAQHALGEPLPETVMPEGKCVAAMLGPCEKLKRCLLPMAIGINEPRRLKRADFISEAWTGPLALACDRLRKIDR